MHDMGINRRMMTIRECMKYVELDVGLCVLVCKEHCNLNLHISCDKCKYVVRYMVM